MPWTCNNCNHTLRIDVEACTECGTPKTSWTLADRTRTLVVPKGGRSFDCRRGDTDAPPSTAAEYASFLWSTTRVVTAWSVDAARELMASGALPGPLDVLTVRLFTGTSADRTLTLTPNFERRLVEDLAFDQSGVEPNEEGFIDVRFLLLFGAGDPVTGLAFDGLELLDISDPTPQGYAPTLEVMALGKRFKTLEVQPRSDGNVMHVLEMEDTHFNFDSAVMLPDYEDCHSSSPDAEPQDRVTGLAVLATGLRFKHTHPHKTLFVAGHTDTSGSAYYNQPLSELRASSVVHLLMQGGRAGWINVSQQKHKTKDYQQILTWVDEELEWDCDPDGVDGIHGPNTTRAVKAFQTRYNSEGLGDPIGVTGTVTPPTWGAFYDVYMLQLAELLETDASGLEALKLTELLSAGCGESFPIEEKHRDEYRSETNRRVELLFFDPGELPDSLPCHPGAGLKPELCPLYGPGSVFERRYIPCGRVPPPPSINPPAAEVHLSVRFLDPAGTPRALPTGMPVTVVFELGPPSQLEVGEEGHLTFPTNPDQRSFTLRFQHEGPTYLATPPDGQFLGISPTVLLPEAEVEARASEGWRVLKLPLPPGGSWGFAESVWKIDGEAKQGQRFDLTQGAIGSLEEPKTTDLDPRWQYVQIVFFDRHARKTVSIPPVLLEGCIAPGGVLPFTRSNWTNHDPHDCLCLPWILGLPPAFPELVFTTPENTFVNTDPAGERSLVTGTPKNLPTPTRLWSYDLPSLWRSRQYHTRRVDSAGKTTPLGIFEDVYNQPTSAETPFRFSLDDMVLTDAELSPIGWVRSDARENRIALFSNTFKSGTDLNEHGLYKPDSKRPYLTAHATADAGRNYVWDFPDWTRLVVAQGNLFDAFDRRTPDRPGQVVGARAAVRWVNALEHQDKTKAWKKDAKGDYEGAPHDSDPRPGLLIDPRGDAFKSDDHPFFAIQPYLLLSDQPAFTQSVKDPQIFARTDLALLRCCDEEDGRELAITLSYHRYFYDFSAVNLPAKHAEKLEDAFKAPDRQRQYGNDVALRITDRWHGREEARAAPRVRLQPEHPNHEFMEDPARRVRFVPRWFVQDEPVKNRAHYRIEVKKEDFRSFMNQSEGETDWASIEDQPDKAAAHEAAHAAGLVDEYVERGMGEAAYAYPLAGFHYHTPGSPYVESQGVMADAFDGGLHARYWWHQAEWLRSLDGGRYFVEHAEFKYRLPAHPDSPKDWYIDYSHPLREHRDHTHRTGKFDLFLFPMGDDEFSHGTELPNPTGVTTRPDALAPGHDLDGLLKIVVKMKFTFDLPAHDADSPATYFKDAMVPVGAKFQEFCNDRLAGHGRGRFVARGKTAAPKPVEFTKGCLIRVDSRFMGTTFAKDKKTDDSGKLVEGDDPVVNTEVVKNQSEWDAQVKALEEANGAAHWHIVVKKGSSAGARFSGHRIDVTVTRDDWKRQVVEVLAPKMGRMLGLPKDDLSQLRKEHWTDLVKAVIPSLTGIDELDAGATAGATA